ncbi:hypothetical protein O181_018539 [Austropuccinia psidii MF-1]|uniref:Uncharacterized protein n=1 Tax=Austropuccinia psidii MF-1 TaxID=1389203 RepID=A0A9Q3GTV7_9BASI|nr:hypothetical protein [Austropuccinia psidii MF-1]
MLLTNGQITKIHNVLFDKDTFPQPFNQHALNSSNMIEEEELPLCKTNKIPFSTTMEEQPCDNLSNTAPGKPGWEIKPTSKKAPKTVSEDLDKSNILQTRQNLNMESINYNLPNPKSWNKAMRSPDQEAWIFAFKNELESL